MGAKELDDLYISLGVCGWFPLGIWVLNMLANSCTCLLYLGNALATHQPRFWCSDLRVYRNNVSEDPLDGIKDGDSFPERLVNLSRADICFIGCPGSNWSFEDPKEHSMASEWGLVCDREYLLNMTETFFYVGNLLACLFCGYLSDKFGRRRIVMASAALNLVAGMQAAWIDDVRLYIAIRFFLGLSYVGLFTVETYKSETFSSKHRMMALVLDPTWTIAGAAVPWLSYALPSWRSLVLILYGINLLVLPATWIIPETPPWLIKRGRADEALEVMRRAAKARGKELEDEEWARVVKDDCVDDDDDESASDFSRHIRSPLIVGSLFVAGLSWTVRNLTAMGITFTYGTLSGNRYLNFSLLQLGFLPGTLIGFLSCRFLYRRPTMFFGCSIVAAGFLGVACVRGVVGDVDAVAPVFRRVVNICIAVVNEAVNRTFLLWLQEAFPTLIRARSFFIAMLIGRFAAIAASYLPYFQTRTPLAVELTQGGLNLVLGVTLALIPETQGRPIPQTFRDMRRLMAETKSAPFRILYRTRKASPGGVDSDDDRRRRRDEAEKEL